MVWKNEAGRPMRWGCGLGRGGCWWLGANGAPHCYGYAGAQATYRLGVRRHSIRSPSPRARPSPGMGAKRARPTLCYSEAPLPGFCRGNPPKLVGGLPTACRKSCASLLSPSSSQPTSSLSLSRTLLYALFRFHLSSPALFRFFTKMDILLR